MKRAAVVALLIVWPTLSLPAQQYSAAGKVINTRHDLSVSSADPQGTTYKATSQTQVCVFCHTPHKANPAAPLWNHTVSGSSYTLYTSSTLVAAMAQPTSTDNTRLCLSCHDGTVALGNTVNNGNITMANSVTTLPVNAGTTYTPPRNTNLSTSLVDDHPVAFTPTFPVLPAYPQVQTPPAGDAVALESGKVQCTTCHNPHEEAIDTTERRFLRKVNSGAAICTTCHKWQGSSGGTNAWNWTAGPSSDHQSHTNTYNGSTNDPVDSDSSFLGAHTGYTTTATNACEACHRPHTAHVTQRLLKGGGNTAAGSAQVCYQCHDGNLTTNIKNPPTNTVVQNIKTTGFNGETYKHPGSTVAGSSGATDSGHDPAETLPISTSRHAACDDCHNPHAAKGYESGGGVFPVPPNLPSTLWGVRGVTRTGAARNRTSGNDDALYEYEICFKCHADSTNKPQTTQDNGLLPPSSTGIGYGYLPKRIWNYQTPTSIINGGQTPVASPSNLNWNSPVASIDRANIRLKFTDHTTYPSYHPVVDARNLTTTRIPSLRLYVKDVNGNDITSRPLGPSSIIYCTDCHNNDTGRDTVSTRSGTTSPAGPHGSANAHLLERPLEAWTGSGADIPNGLCGKCHDATKHVFDANKVDHHQKCTFCHDPHASRSVYLINWDCCGYVDGDTNYVAPSVPKTGNTNLYFNASYGNCVSCYVTCHSHDHNPATAPSCP